MLGAIGPRTKLVYIATPNNPTGTMTRPRRARRATSSASPSTCSPCSTRRTSSTSTTPTIRTGSRSTRRRGGACSSCARSRRSTASPVSASATASARPTCRRDRQGPARLRRLDAGPGRRAREPRRGHELARRRDETREGRALDAALREHGLAPLEGVANFLCVDVGDGAAFAQRLERQGAIVRPLGPFGDPSSVRISVGSPAELTRLFAAIDEGE